MPSAHPDVVGAARSLLDRPPGERGELSRGCATSPPRSGRRRSSPSCGSTRRDLGRLAGRVGRRIGVLGRAGVGPSVAPPRPRCRRRCRPPPLRSATVADVDARSSSSPPRTATTAPTAITVTAAAAARGASQRDRRRASRETGGGAVGCAPPPNAARAAAIDASRRSASGASSTAQRGPNGAQPLDLGDDLGVGLGTRPFLAGHGAVEGGAGEEALVVVHGAGAVGSPVGRPVPGSWFPRTSASWPRPRAIRDFTVPTGTPSTSAISA